MFLNTRRHFLQKTGLASLSLLFASDTWGKNLQNALDNHQQIDAETLATSEDFWHYVQQSYTTSGSIINLNNGGVSPSPKIVQDAMKRYHDMSNEAPSYYMWRILDQGREPLRERLAQLADVSAEEIALHRNASEALETIIFGLNLKAGDEVVLSKQDYPNMINAWKQREMRDGIKLVWVNHELPSVDNDYLANNYIDLFTARTKVVHITHIINWNGQILPVRQIADIAKKQGIEVLVDGAHSFAHFDFSITDLQCDYFGTSLHKWLGATIGTGFMYVRKEKIKSLFPLFGVDDPLKDDIRKFEALGTRPFFIEQAIEKAIDFHKMIGIERKEARLNYLKNYWINQVKDLPNIIINTPLQKGFSCAIANIAIKDKKHEDLDTFLFEKYKIHVVSITWENIKGIRITPNVYTTLENLDRLVEGIRKFATS
ncbi:MAG: aminotransferase class V-fold PLP-dependent enzyme [Bacteroidetes bacterium]|nr:aminotransferase class V-fold PLP-dependent enzyme [Bacteroidota bacterium]MBK8329510.1 aminotransferase class V-fold PLP-dependent enzyme [Bacteroidota bacterium]